MRYLKDYILLAAIIFILFLFNYKKVDTCTYYSTKEEYHVNIENQQIKIPIFVDSSDCIFKSSLPNYYLETENTTLKLKKIRVQNGVKTSAFNEDVYCYFILFELNLEKNKSYNNVILHVEMPEKSLYLQIGNIIMEELENRIIAVNKNEEGIFISDENYDVVNGLSFPKIYHDSENKKTYFVPDSPMLYYYFIYKTDKKMIGIIENSDFNLLELKLKEGSYA